VFELRQQFRKGDPAKEIMDLLQRLKRRIDLLAVVLPDIDHLQREVDGGRSSEVLVESPTCSTGPENPIGNPPTTRPGAEKPEHTEESMDTFLSPNSNGKYQVFFSHKEEDAEVARLH
jgi:hypothetical protein